MLISKWFAVFAVFGLVSCGAPHQLGRVAPEKNEIAGVQSALDRTKTADVVFVQGMCYHDKEWVASIKNNLATSEVPDFRDGVNEARPCRY